MQAEDIVSARPSRAGRADPSSQEGPALLELTDLAGSRGDRSLFQGLNLSLAPGQVVWLRGRNGRGKTTLLRMLAGLAPAAHGQIFAMGQQLSEAPPELRSRLGYIAHANALKDDLTAAEALSFLASLSGHTAQKTDVLAALKMLGIASRAQAPVRTLSQGQRRRVTLARLALPAQPRVWLLDEPFDALDDRGIDVLNRLLAEHASRGGAVLLTSHQALSLSIPRLGELNLDDYTVLA